MKGNLFINYKQQFLKKKKGRRENERKSIEKKHQMATTS